MTHSTDKLPVKRLWYTRCPAPTPFGIAIQQGWLQDEFASDGIDVKALQDSNDPAIRQSHFTHSQAHSFRQGGNIPALWASAQGADTRVIGLSWVDEFQGLIALPSTGIEGPANLRGRRFGLPRNTRAQVVDFHRATALRGFVSLLGAVGLTLDDIQLVDLPTAPRGLADEPAVGDAGAARLLATERGQEFSFEVLALARDEVDVVFVKGASGLEAANLIGARAIVDLSDQPDKRLHANNGTPRPLTVDAALLRERPDLVARVLSRAIEAGEWASAHPQASIAYVARETRSAEHWARHAYGAQLGSQLQIGLDRDAIAALDDFKRFLFKQGFIAQDFDIASWIDPVPLASARALLAERRLKVPA
ncbi:nitrate ABC transporter substrate-binding protein [Caballeronia sordidicola]|uniref:Nitrate ABC transporter substrate-binding protein n=1 Tax=Caballeronia sordidicola TaxID=196367 RepID=A0A158IGZ1_CABSO|nr:ABC transporter substrate-binding protein [Caballeronia sordidicola]SAL55653.1 nitrate ABC transporter substrate-binding protein [Caballeronia sordidicola]